MSDDNSHDSLHRFTGPPAVSGVYNLSEIRIVYAVGLLSKNPVAEFRNPVPVYSGSGEQLAGFADVSSASGGCFANLYLSRNIPERLDLENGEKLTAVPELSSGVLARIFIRRFIPTIDEPERAIVSTVGAPI